MTRVHYDKPTNRSYPCIVLNRGSGHTRNLHEILDLAGKIQQFDLEIDEAAEYVPNETLQRIILCLLILHPLRRLRISFQRLDDTNIDPSTKELITKAIAKCDYLYVNGLSFWVYYTKIDELSKAIKESTNKKKIVQIDLFLDNPNPNEQIAKAICNLLDANIRVSLFLRGFVPNETKEIIMKASGKCKALCLRGYISDDAIITLSHFLEQNGGVEKLELLHTKMSDMAWKILSKTKLGNGADIARMELSTLDSNNALTRLRNNLSGFSTLIITNRVLTNNQATVSALLDILSSDCPISGLEFNQPFSNSCDASSFLKQFVEAITNNTKLKNLVFVANCPARDLAFLAGNLYKFQGLEHVRLCGYSNTLDFLRPLLLAHPSTLPQSLRSINLNGMKLKNSTQEADLLLQLSQTYPRLERIKGVDVSPLVRHTLEMNYWRPFLLVPELTSISHVMASVEEHCKNKPTRTGDYGLNNIDNWYCRPTVEGDIVVDKSVVASVHNEMLKHFIGYGIAERKRDYDQAGTNPHEFKHAVVRKRKKED